MNKKLLIIVVSTIILLVVSALVIYFVTRNSAESISKKYQKIIVDQHWSTDENFKVCNKDKKYSDCISIAYRFLAQGSKITAEYINYDQNKLENDLSAIDSLIETRDYLKSFNQTKKLIDNINTSYALFWDKNEAEFEKIDQKIGAPSSTFSANYKFIDKWVIVNQFSSSDEPANPAVVLLAKEQGQWKQALSLGTGLTLNDLQHLNLPESVITEYIKNPLNFVVLYDKNINIPEYLYINTPYIDKASNH
jgi:hypothetical protein